MDYSTQGLPVHHKLLEFTQTHVHWIGDAIQPSHPLLSPSPPTFNLSQHQSFEMSQFFASGVLTLCRRTSCTVAKVLEPTTGFSTWESDKGTENPPGNLSLKAVGFDYRTSTLRKQTLGGHKKNLMWNQDPGERAVTPQETEPDFPVSVQESPAETWLHSGLWWGQEHWIQQSWELWLAVIIPERGHRYHLYPYHILASGRTTGRESSPTN